MLVRTLLFQILPDGKGGRKLKVLGPQVGLETPVSLEELETLSAHLRRQAEDWRNEMLSLTRKEA